MALEAENVCVHSTLEFGLDSRENVFQVTGYSERNSRDCGVAEGSSESINTIIACCELECYQR
jgi:hypothetical protein